MTDRKIDDPAFPGDRQGPGSERLEISEYLDRLRSYAGEADLRLAEVHHIYQKMLAEAEEVCRLNEKAYQDLKRIRHKLIEARTLADLFTVLIAELKLLAVDQVRIHLVREVLAEAGEELSALPLDISQHLSLVRQEEIRGWLKTSGGLASYIGPRENFIGEGLFTTDISSCLLAPMVHHDRLIGALGLGSRVAARFAADRSPDLVEDLAGTTALCLDSVVTHQQTATLARTDPLTGAYNRRYFYEAGALSFRLARRHGYPLACLYIDINDFKHLNDRFGHDLGDQALVSVSGFLKSRLRQTDILARLGGDEFALVLPYTDLDTARELAVTLRQGISRIRMVGVNLDGWSLSASLGAAVIYPEDTGLEDLINRADQAMYLDKSGKE